MALLRGKVARSASVALFGVLLAMALCVGSAHAQEGSIEYELKAAFLFRFSEFVEWPVNAFPTPQSSIRICVLGTDPFGDALDRTLQGARVDGRSVVAARIQGVEQATGCHILFISRSEASQASGIISRLRGTPALTVADSGNFLQLGGTINFVTERGRVRFDINLGGAQNAQLQLSSKLLRLARVVLPVRRDG